MKSLIGKKVDMVNESIPKSALIFALPLLFSGWLQLLYSAADLITCGNFGSENSVGAISATSSLTSLIISLCMGFSVGANVLIAQAVGAQDKEKGKRIIISTYILALISGIILLILGVTCSKYFLKWMGTPDELLDLSNTYMVIYFIGIPFTLIYNFGAALLRGLGDTTKPFIFLAIAGAINVGLNFLFVITFNLDVAGVAITTTISQAISAILVTITLIKDKRYFVNLDIRYTRFYKNEILGIIKIGIPAGLQSALFSLSNVILQSSINSFGKDAVTGTGAESSIESFLSTGVDAFAQATVAFVGANYGAKNASRIKKSIFYTSLYGCIFAALGGLFCFFLARPLLRIYTDNEAAINYGVEKLKIVSTTYIIYCLSCTISSGIRGMGYSFMPMAVSLIGICVLRIVYIYTIFPLDQFHTIFGLYISYPLSWLITVIAHFICLFFCSKKAYKRMNEPHALA